MDGTKRSTLLRIRAQGNYARTHRVLIRYTYLLIAAAGTQPHNASVPVFHNQVVSYHPVCMNKNSRCGL